MTLEEGLMLHGGNLILPLAVIEGPVVSVVTGILSASGYVRWYWGLLLLICADLIGDVMWYAAGRAGLVLAARFYPGPELRRRLTDNATKMILIGKWTHAIGLVVLIGCGALRMPLPRFMLVNLLATIPKSAILFGIGFFAAGYFPVFQQHAVFVTVLLVTAGLAATALTFSRARTAGAGP